VEIDIKVPLGFTFLQFLGGLKLVGGRGDREEKWRRRRSKIKVCSVGVDSSSRGECV
jgi:hypothetical protein